MILLPCFLDVAKCLAFYCLTLLRHGENTKATYIIGHRRGASASKTTMILCSSTTNQRWGAERQIPEAVLGEAMISFHENCHWKCLVIGIAIRKTIRPLLISVIVKCARANRLSEPWCIREGILSVVKHRLQQTRLNYSWSVIHPGLNGGWRGLARCCNPTPERNRILSTQQSRNKSNELWQTTSRISGCNNWAYADMIAFLLGRSDRACICVAQLEYHTLYFLLLSELTGLIDIAPTFCTRAVHRFH